MFSRVNSLAAFKTYKFRRLARKCGVYRWSIYGVEFRLSLADPLPLPVAECGAERELLDLINHYLGKRHADRADPRSVKDNIVLSMDVWCDCVALGIDGLGNLKYCLPTPF